MKIIKMLMLEVGTYNDVHQRPYHAHVDGHALSVLQESTDNGRNLTPAALSSVGAEIMRVSSTAGNVAEIINGYDQPRLCFMMEIEFPGTGGVTMVEWLMGYTDHVGVSATYGDARMVFDPNMRLTFNNVLRGRRTTVARAFGNTVRTAVNDSYQLINGSYQPQITNVHQAPHLLRPQDVFTNLSMDNARSLLGHDEVLDLRPTHGPERIAVNNRRNSIPGSYLSRVLQVWKHESEFEEVDPSSLNSQMAAKIAEPTISNIRSVQQLAVISDLRRGGTVTWSELVAADDLGQLEDRVVITLAQSPASRARLAHRGEAEFWHGNSNTTVIASAFVQAVPGIMMSLMLTEMDVSITNRTHDGEWDVTIQDWESFNGGDDVEQVQAFQYKMATELMPGLSRGGQHEIELHASFSVTGETRLEISVDGSPMTPFIAPTFCDGLSAAVRAPDRNTLDRFAHTLGGIMNNLEQDYSADDLAYSPFDLQHSDTERTPNPFDNHSSKLILPEGIKYENSGSL